MRGIIEVDGLTKRYQKAKELAVDNISFSVAQGDFFAFLGPNGAGKTTTISILTTTLAKTSGRVTIAGYDLEHETRQIRAKVGIIFQKPSLDKTLSAEENIRLHACLYGLFAYRPFFRWMPAAYKNRVMELAEIVGLKDKIFQRVNKLSGGMQRKLEILRSLMHTPDILFLDEPTQGLDAVSRRALWNYINTIRQKHGTTVFLTTHYIDEAEQVDALCVINRGRIAFTGTPRQLKALLPQKPVMKLSEPTLEDAYVDLLSRTGGSHE